MNDPVRSQYSDGFTYTVQQPQHPYAAPSGGPGTLPFTGLDLAVLIVCGLILMGLGTCFSLRK